MTDPNQQMAHVTAWWRLDKEQGGFVFNHLEDGWSVQDRPHDTTGKRWTRGTWYRCHARLCPGGLMGARRLELLQPAPAHVTDLDTTTP